MTSSSANSKLSDPNPPTYYHPIPTNPPPPQYVVVLPYYSSPPSTFTLFCNAIRRYCFCLFFLVLLGSAVYILYPSDPDVSIVRVRLDGLTASFDITLGLTVKLWNKDFYSLDYETLVVSIGYRGEQLGLVTSKGGHIQARASSYIDAELKIDGTEVLFDVIPLIEDLARGSITFDTVTAVNGTLSLLFLEIPIQAKIACEIVVGTQNQTITRQNCYPV